MTEFQPVRTTGLRIKFRRVLSLNDHDEEAVRHDEAATEDAAAEVATAQAALKAAEVETVAAEAAATVRIDDWIGTAWDMVDGGS